MNDEWDEEGRASSWRYDRPRSPVPCRMAVVWSAPNERDSSSLRDIIPLVAERAFFMPLAGTQVTRRPRSAAYDSPKVQGKKPAKQSPAKETPAKQTPEPAQDDTTDIDAENPELLALEGTEAQEVECHHLPRQRTGCKVL